MGFSVRILVHVAVTTVGRRVIAARSAVFVRRRTGPHVSIASPERLSERVRRCIVNTRPPEVYRVDDRREKRPQCGIGPDPEPGESAVLLMKVRRGRSTQFRRRIPLRIRILAVADHERNAAPSYLMSNFHSFDPQMRNLGTGSLISGLNSGSLMLVL